MDEKDFRRRSNVTGDLYNYFDTVKVKNPNQAAAYMIHNVYPKDIRATKDEEGRRIITFYFDKEESKEVFDLWCKHELE